MVDFIYYSVGDKKAKVTKEAQEEFEKKYPDAKIHLTYNGRNAQVSLNSRDAFLSKYGADNITYSAYDEDKQYSPDLSVNKYFDTNQPVDAPEDANVSISAEMPISRRQQRKAEREAEWLENRAANADMANATIESHQSHKEKIDEYLSSVDKEYKEKQSSEPKKSFWQRLTESMTQAGSERRLGASSYTVDLKKQDIEKGQDYVDAKIAKNISNKIDDKVEEYNDPAKNFVYGVGHGLADTVFDIDTWDSTVGAEEAARVYAITKKLDRGETLTDGEQMIIDALVDDLASDMYMASGFGRGYKAGKVTGESLPFMLETALNPASGFGKQFTKKFGKEVFKQVSKRLGKAAGKAAVYTTRVGADIAGAAMMSATTSQARVAEDALNRLSGDVDFKLNDEGTLDFNGFIGGEDSAFKAYAKAFGANTIEHFSEMVGNYFAPIGQMAKSGTAQLANKIGLKKVSELLTEMTPNGFGSLINDFTERTQWQGVIGEFSEEMVSGALNALIVGDQSLKKYDDNGNINPNYLFEKDNMIDTFLGVAILGGAISAVKTVGYTTPETRYNREISRAKKNLSEYFNEDEISQLEAFASNPMGASYANLTPFFEDSRKKEAKEAAGRYLAAVLNKQGYEIARNADLSGTQQGMNEMRMAAQLGQNMTEADLYDVTEEETKALRAVEETGLLERLDENDTQYLLRDAASYELFKASNEPWRTDSEREALKNLALVRNAREGLENTLNNRAQAFIDASNRISTESATDGVLTVGVHDGQIVFVKGGVRVDNGGIVSPDFVSGYPVEIVNSVTGEASTVDSSEISHAFNVDVDTYNTNNGNTIKAYFQQKWDKFRNTKSVKSKLAEVEQLVGQTVYIDNGNGNNMAEVEIMQILPNGEVVIKGKKGDLGGQSTLRVDVDSFYDSMTRDANGNPIFDQSKFRSQTENINNAQSRIYNQEQTTTEVTPQEAETTEKKDYRDYEGPILIGGRLIDVIETQQDDSANKVNYTYVDENGEMRVGSTSITEFGEAIKQAEEQNQNPTPAPIENPEPIVNEPTPAPTDVPTEIEPVAEEINWDALFEQDQEAFFAELQKQFGEETLDILNEFVSAAQEELDSLNKKKRSSNPNDIIATRNQKAALQKRIDAYNQMIARLAPAPEAPVVEEPTSETPVEVTPTEPTVEPAPTEPVEETPITEVPTDGKSENGFEFNEHNVCTNPEIISVPSVKKGWAVMNEVRLAEYNGKWGSAISAHTNMGGNSSPLTKRSCVYDTKEEAISNAYNALVRFRDSRINENTKDVGNLIKHLEKEYPFVKEAATPAPAPQPAPAEPITTENGFVIVDKVITNPEVIEMPNTPEGDANRIFIGEYNGKWTYGAEALMDNGSWGKTPEMRIELARYNTREEAIKAAISFLENQWRNKRKDAGSAALDAFVQYVKENYLPKASETEGDSVSLENEPTVENNGSEGETASNEAEGQGADNMGGRADNEGVNAGEETIAEEQSAHENSDNAEGGLDNKYPPRKGDVTPKDLENTFGFKHVATILPQSVLNSSYDVFMGMAKMLGISPKSITHGGELRLAKLDDSAPKGYDAAYSQDGRNNNRVQYTAIKLREGRNLAGVAHEWWHSLDHMLRHWNSGRGTQTITNSSANTFDGRPEVLSAVKDLLKAIKDSGHISRIDGLGYSSSDKTYLKSRVEQTARAFEEYIIGKFAEAGITIEGVYKDSWIAQPTAEEMKIIAPAFDNLFKVLQEKEGRNPGSSVLYHIGEMAEQNNEAKNQLGALVADWIQQGGNFVVMDNEAMLNALEESGNARMLETPDGVIYGFVKDGVVYLNPSLLNANTSIHEYTHLWDNALMQLNRPLWEKGKALMKKTALWKEVVNDPNYADIKDNEDLVASEVHSRLVGAEGAKRLEQLEQEAREKGLTKGAKDLSILGRLREWLNEAAQWLKDTFSVWSKEEIDAVSLDDFLNMPLRDLANFTALPQSEQNMPEDNLSEETREELADHGLVMEGGVIMSEDYAELKRETGYKTPIEKGQIQFSYGTRQAHIANYLQHPEAEQRVVDLLERFAERLSMNELVNGVVSTSTKHKYGKKEAGSFAGPLRTNVEYIITFDLDTTCPRTFQYLNLVKRIEKRIGRPLTQTECVQLTEMMRMYGQQIPCVYCYAENKRQALKDLYTRFMDSRHAVLSAKTDAEALQYMYGHKTGKDGESSDPKIALNDAAYKVFIEWRTNPKGTYNPTIKMLWASYTNDRNSVLTILDQLYASKAINTDMSDEKISEDVAKEFRVSNKKAIKVIEEIVGEWKWNTIEGKQHEDFVPVDEDDLGVSENALEIWRDMTSYAKSASSAKSVIRYTPYTDELKKVSQEDRDYINGMGGVRMHSTNDFRIDYVFDYFQFMADMALNKMFGHTYTKSPEFVRIFGNSGYKINMSIAAYQDEKGNIRPNADEGFDWEEAKRLRQAFPNAGTMLMATSDEQIQMALDSDWIDMVIPFHQSGLPKSIWYNMRMWTDYQSIQKELFLNTDEKKAALKADGVEIPKKAKSSEIEDLYNEHFKIEKIYDKKGKRIAPHFLPGPTKKDGNDIPGHNNDHQKYLELCRKYGVKPRFAGLKVKDNTPEGGGKVVDITEHPRYMILIKETARTDSPQTPIMFNFDEPSEALGGKTPLDYAFEELESRAMAESELEGKPVSDIYNSLKKDQFGIEDQFINSFIKYKNETGKELPIDYLTPDSREWFLVQRKALEEAFKDVETIPYHRNEYDENGNLAKLADERMARINERAEAEDDGILSRSGDVTPEMDAAYMEAVEAGDMETAQRMVIEAAKLAMPNTKVLAIGMSEAAILIKR
jgi:hypothetical protein